MKKTVIMNFQELDGSAKCKATKTQKEKQQQQPVCAPCVRILAHEVFVCNICKFGWNLKS